MFAISYARHQFPPVVTQHAVWLYLRFTLSYRDVEELLAERGLDISYETVRRSARHAADMRPGSSHKEFPRPSERLESFVPRIGRAGAETVGLAQRMLGYPDAREGLALGGSPIRAFG